MRSLMVPKLIQDKQKVMLNLLGIFLGLQTIILIATLPDGTGKKEKKKQKGNSRLEQTPDPHQEFVMEPE